METQQPSNIIIDQDNIILISKKLINRGTGTGGKNTNIETQQSSNIIIDQNITHIPNKIINGGTGAGGKNTNIHGKQFEDLTNNENRLIENGYVKKFYNNKKQIGSSNYYLYKKYENYEIIFVLQGGLKAYMNKILNIELFRNPDEAYIIKYNDGKYVIKILEKKAQHYEGSVEDKLLSCVLFRREYELALENKELALENKIKVYYAFCVSSFLQQKLTSKSKKYLIWNKMFEEANIEILFGEDENYFIKLDSWINNSL